MRLNHEPSQGIDNTAPACAAFVGGRRLLFVGLGTTGHKIGVRLEAKLEELFGRVPDAVRVLVFDVDRRQEVVLVERPSDSEKVTVALEPGIQFFPIGRGLDVSKLAWEAMQDPALHPDMARLVRLQPDGRFARTLERGAEGEPLFGLMGWLWSLAQAKSALRASLRHLLDLRLAADGQGSRAITVIIAGSLAGGCGAPLLLPAAKEIREVMNEIGIDPAECLFVELAVTPEAFPESAMRLAVAGSTLRYHDRAFAEGWLPMAGQHTPPRRPFDLPLLVAPITELGHTLRGIDDVAAALALASVILGSYPLREAAAALLSNLTRRMEERLPTGEPMAYGALGVASYHFPRKQVADFFAHRLVELLLDALLEDRPDDVQHQVRDVFQAHFLDVDSLMSRAQRNQSGEPLLGDFAQEAGALIRRAKGGAKLLLARLQEMETVYVGRTALATETACGTAKATLNALGTSLHLFYRATLDSRGPKAGSASMEAALELLARHHGHLERQREDIKQNVSAQRSVREQAASALQRLASRGWMRGGRRLKEALQSYLQATGEVLYGQFVLDLAEAALSSLAEVRQLAHTQRTGAEELVDTLASVRIRCRTEQTSFLEAPAPPTSAEHVVHQAKDLRALFGDAVAEGFDRLAPDALRGLRQRVTGVADWIGIGADEAYRRLKAAVAVDVERVAAMSVDDYLAWLLKHRNLAPETFLRSALEQASPLCRLERSRLPGEEDLAESTFCLAGVPDPERSVLAGLPGVHLVSTPDQERIVFVTVKAGFPASALWRAAEYQEAYGRVKAGGTVALDIYPDEPPVGGHAAVSRQGQREHRGRRLRKKG